MEKDLIIVNEFASKNQLISLIQTNDSFCILLVDDEHDILDVLKDELSTTGIKIITAATPKDALELIQKNASSLCGIISDYRMPEMSGIELRKSMLENFGHIPFLILSGHVDREMALQGVEAKISAFLDKPVDFERLYQTLVKEFAPRMETIRDDRELLKGFLEDASSLLEQLEPMILELEDSHQRQDSINRIFGMVHTIKGSSGFFQPKTLHSFAHRFEDVLKDLQSGVRQITPELISVMLTAIDTLKKLVEEFRTENHNAYDLKKLCSIFDPDSIASQATANITGDESKVANPAAQSQSKKAAELKIAVSILDEFQQISGEMTVIRNMINKAVQSIEKNYPTDKDVGYLSELLEELHKINGAMQGKMVEIRKVPMKNVMKSLPRVVRDTSKSLGKKIQLETLGDDLLVDTSIAEVLSNSLIHLVRNSLDHGIESPEKRTQIGKPSEGSITISSELSGETVLIRIEDDGNGLDPERIKQKLIKNGTHTLDEVNRMSENDIFHMIFSSGFSTAEKISDVSGRGVGMSMVKESVESIGGKIEIKSILGKGATFELYLPIPKSVHITNSLFISVDGREFGIPQDSIIRILHVSEPGNDQRIKSLEGASVICVDGTMIPLVSLSHILSKNEKEVGTINTNHAFSIVCLKTQKNIQFGLMVDHVRDVEDTVIKPVVSSLKSIRLYTGATFLGDASVGLLLDIEGIAEHAHIHAHANLTTQESRTESIITDQASQTLITFKVPEADNLAILQSAVYRFEEIDVNSIQKSGDEMVIPYREGILPLIDMGKVINQTPLLSSSTLRVPVLVVSFQSKQIGLVVSQIIDLFETSAEIIPPAISEDFIVGCIVHKNKTLSLIDPEKIIQKLIHQSDLLQTEDTQPFESQMAA